MPSIGEVTDRRTGLLDAAEIVGRLNQKLTGWANCFCLGPVSPAYQQVDIHVRERLRRCGGMYVALVWLWLVDDVTLTRWDLAGASIALAGMAVIALQPEAR